VFCTIYKTFKVPREETNKHGLRIVMTKSPAVESESLNTINNKACYWTGLQSSDVYHTTSQTISLLVTGYCYRVLSYKVSHATATIF
jgi:hypothetical protein